jgi:hypothetical protein
VTSAVTCLYFLNIQNHFVCVLNTVNNNFNSASVFHAEDFL